MGCPIGWKHSHNTHHATTNKLTEDPDRLWRTPEEYFAMPKIGRYLWELFHTRLFFMSAVGHYFKSIFPWAFRIREKSKNPRDHQQAIIDIAILFISMTILHITLYQFVGIKSLIVHAFIIIIGFMGLSTYVRTQHFLLANGSDVHNKPWLTSRTIKQHRFFDFLVTNLNYHIEHHILQTIPHANLPKLKPMMKQLIEEAGVNYEEQPLWGFLKMAFNHPFTILHPETKQEIPLDTYLQENNLDRNGKEQSKQRQCNHSETFKQS